MPVKHETKYLVAKETYVYTCCKNCSGSGKTTHRFQQKLFTNNCFACGGTGLEKITHRTEITLQQALSEINNNKKGIKC